MPCLPESGDCGGRCCNEMSAVPPQRHVIICNSLSSRVASGAHCAALFSARSITLPLLPKVIYTFVLQTLLTLSQSKRCPWRGYGSMTPPFLLQTMLFKTPRASHRGPCVRLVFMLPPFFFPALVAPCLCCCWYCCACYCFLDSTLKLEPCQDVLTLHPSDYASV